MHIAITAKTVLRLLLTPQFRVHGIETKLESNWEHVIYQKLANSNRKMISMLTGLKVSSLACKCAFETSEQQARRDPMETNFEGLEMKK